MNSKQMRTVIESIELASINGGITVQPDVLPDGCLVRYPWFPYILSPDYRKRIDPLPSDEI